MIAHQIERLIAEAKVLAGGQHRCSILGHNWIHVGGTSCGCEVDGCSIPVYECKFCGDSDYGENQESVEIRNNCQQGE